MLKKDNRKIKTEGSERSRRIVVAMSGGVDSSVAVALLKKQGYFVVGVFMKFWKDPSAGSGQAGENRCCSIESEKLARLVAKKIGIPFYVINVEKEFKKKVVDYFLKEYKKGATPNPCVVCNKEIKFGFLIDKALKMGVDYIATGHYAKTSLGNQIFLGKGILPLHSKNLLPRSFKLLKSVDKNKDQSYFLWQLNQKQLSRVLFPVGNYTKSEVRALARKFNLPVAETKESQEICFAQNSTNEFLKKYLKTKPGNIIDKNRKILGEHQGLHFYTIGQRKGIGLSGGPYFVVDKDFKKNNLIISKNEKDLESQELIAKNINWSAPQKLPISAEVKIRYKSNFAKAKIFKAGARKIKVVFQKPQKAITPGQSAVFYKGDNLLGGGVIE
ncbi:MAG: tRNA 2-thiouridine(34) synthase MnmA [Patescibacteria group bacterium]